MEPWDVIHSNNGGPYAVKTCLGWIVIGPKVTLCDDSATAPIFKVNNIRTKAKRLEEMITTLYNDFTEKDSLNVCETMSQEDKLWQLQIERSIQLKETNYEIALPFKSKNVHLPNNRTMAERRIIGLKRRLDKDPALHKRYTQYMTELIERGHAVPVSADSHAEEGKKWYLPHHSVQHPAKPRKTRVVFDASAKYFGTSLNDQLLQGPNLANTLIGVLIRFREEKVAFMADIQEMFYQVQVPERDINFFRFLWWPGGDTSKDLEEFAMKKHIFGCVSSPGCANFALKQCANTISKSAQKQQRQ